MKGLNRNRLVMGPIMQYFTYNSARHQSGLQIKQKWLDLWDVRMQHWKNYIILREEFAKNRFDYDLCYKKMASPQVP